MVSTHLTACPHTGHRVHPLTHVLRPHAVPHLPACDLCSIVRKLFRMDLVKKSFYDVEASLIAGKIP